MAKERRKYGTVSSLLDNTKVDNSNSNNENTKIEKEEDKNVQIHVSENVNIENKHNNETKSLNDLSKSINEIIEEKSKKKTMEDTHQRKTFLVERELLKEFNKITKNKRGSQVIIINQLLKAFVESQKE